MKIKTPKLDQLRAMREARFEESERASKRRDLKREIGKSNARSRKKIAKQ